MARDFSGSNKDRRSLVCRAKDGHRPRCKCIDIIDITHDDEGPSCQRRVRIINQQTTSHTINDRLIINENSTKRRCNTPSGVLNMFELSKGTSSTSKRINTYENEHW